MDECLIEKLYNEHRGDMLKLADRILRNRNDAEDVVQEVFLSLLSREKPPRKPKSYLMTGTKNRAIDVIRDRQKQERIAAGAARRLSEDEDEEVNPILDLSADEHLAWALEYCEDELSNDE